MISNTTITNSISMPSLRLTKHRLALMTRALMTRAVAMSVAVMSATVIPIVAHAAIADLPAPAEAESAINTGGVIATSNAGYTGTGYVEFSAEGSVEWSINAPRDGLYQFSVRYALEGTSSRTFNLREKTYSFNKTNQVFAATGSYNNYKSVEIYAKLKAGAQIIRIDSNGNGLPHIDHLLVTFTPPDANKFLSFPVHSSDVMFSGTSANSDAYYKTIDPKSERTTLDKWKAKNGFSGDSAYAKAKYLNAGDLGFGRSMYVVKWFRDSNDNTVSASTLCKVTGDGNCNVASYVQNYATLQDAIDNKNLLATVAMEYAPPINADGTLETTAPKFTKFYVFDAAGKRITKVDLDGRGEKFVPGLCNVCHGGKPKLDNIGLITGYADRGDTGARFIPWDLDTYEFNSSLTRETQEPEFKKLNKFITETSPTAATLDLVRGWYGGKSFPNATFNGAYVPTGWSTTADGDKSKLYKEVMGPSCRSCHYQREVWNNSGHDVFQGNLQESTLTFNSYANFKNYKKEIEYLVYDAGLMPVAKRTYENFWRSNQAVTLDNEMFGGTAMQAPSASIIDYNTKQDFGAWRRPGRPQPNIAGIPSLFGVKTASSVGTYCNQLPIYDLPDVRSGSGSNTARLNALPSLYPNSGYSWSWVDPATCSTVATPAINDATSAVASFSVEAGRTAPYYIRLRASNEYSSINRMIVGRIFPNDNLPRTGFMLGINRLLIKDKLGSTNSTSALACADCHSNGIMFGRARGTFELMDWSIPEEDVMARLKFAYRMVLTRVDCKNPENSLLLRKASGHAHYNGATYGFEDVGNYGDINSRAMILRWIIEGARFRGLPGMADEEGCPRSP